MSGLRIVLAVAVRPWLWWTAIRTALRMRPMANAAALRSFPRYVRFRLDLAYGDTRVPPAGDIVNYLRWCRRFPGRVK